MDIRWRRGQAYAITIPPLTDVTTEQIANQAMTIGAGGIWILRAGATAAKIPSDDRIDFLSYAEPQWMMSEMSASSPPLFYGHLR